MVSPLVPNLPARPTRCRYWSLLSGISQLITTLTLPISIPRANTSVAISKFFLLSLNSFYRSNLFCCGKPPWIVKQLYLLLVKIFSNSFALLPFLINMTNWLNPRSLTSSNTFLFLSRSVRFTYYCCSPCSVKLQSLSMMHSILFLKNLRHVSLTGSDIVAENIMVCLFKLLLIKILWTSFLNDITSSNLSHSSSTNYSMPAMLTLPILSMRCRRPGVATRMCGLRSRHASESFSGTPPYRHSVLMFSPLEKRSNSRLICQASSRVLHKTSPENGLGSVMRLSIIKMNTAVLPVPDLAWQRMSSPSSPWGMHSRCTSDGCSNAFSAMRFINSLLKFISLKDRP